MALSQVALDDRGEDEHHRHPRARLGCFAPRLTQAVGAPACAAGITYCFNTSKTVALIAIAAGAAGNGEITITYDVTATGIPQLVGANTMILVPTIGNVALGAGAAGSMDWHCKGAGSTYAIGTAGTVAARYSPAQCRGAV